MILFVSGATVTPRRYPVGELIVPEARNAPESLKMIPGQWACDNGAFTAFDVELFVAMLERFYGWPGCRFVAVPDVVGDAHGTLMKWAPWSKVVRGFGFPPALVAQDGLTVADVPWREIGALFIGGHTEWKLGPQAADLMAYAKARGLWVHVGRVNSNERIWEMKGKGADSFDGTCFSRWSDVHIPRAVDVTAAAMAQGRLL